MATEKAGLRRWALQRRALFSAAGCIFCGAALAAPSAPVVDLSGNWTAADTHEAAAALARRCLAQPWSGARGKRRHASLRLELDQVRNRTSEFIDTRALRRELGEQLQRAAVAAGVRGLRIVEAKPEARRGQPALRAVASVSSNNDAVSGTELRHTAVALRVIDERTGELLCVAVHQIAKLIERPAAVDDRRKPARAAPPRARVKVTRLKPDARVALSGYFNAVDANRFARRAAASLRRAMARRRRPLVVRLYPFRNRTSMHIETRMIGMLLQEATLGAVTWLVNVNDMDSDGPRRGREPEAVLTGELTSAEAHGRRTIVLTLRLQSVADQTTQWIETLRAVKVVATPRARPRGRR